MGKLRTILTWVGVLQLNYEMPRKKTIQTKTFKIPAPFVKSDKSKLLQPASGWVSLLLCVETYKANVLATAIENYGIFVCDQFNRRVIANEGPSTDLDSKKYALHLIASVAEEERNPNPSPSWEHERWDFEDHPLQRFGWPEGSVPDLESLKRQGVVQAPEMVPWSQRTKAEFESELIKAGTIKAAAQLHGVSRQRYQAVLDRVTGKKKSKSDRATGLHNWMQLAAHKK